MELLGDSLSRISNSNAEKIFLVGDFNLPDFDWINQLPLSLDQLYVNSFEIFNDAFLTREITSQMEGTEYLSTASPKIGNIYLLAFQRLNNRSNFVYYLH